MPYTRTWSEELVAEWLHLQNYFVEVSVPIRTAKPGGRFEADVLGVKIENGVLKIIHVEVGSLSNRPKVNIEKIQKKFNDKNRKAVEDYCKKKLGFNGEINYQSLYIATYVPNTTLTEAKRENINIKSIDEFIQEDVIPTIENWKKNPPFKSKTKGESIVLPDGLWLLHVVERMRKILSKHHKNRRASKNI